MREPFRNTRFLIAETDPARLPQAQLEVAFVGRSNVGKSSLLCALSKNKQLARVSKTPGRTRAINIFEVQRGKWIVDLPGYGYAAVPAREREYWPKMIGVTVGGRPSQSRVYVLLDCERGIMPIDRTMIEWLREGNVSFSLVGTKVDKLGHSQQIQARARIAEEAGLLPNQVFWVSAKKGYGMREFERDVATALNV